MFYQFSYINEKNAKYNWLIKGVLISPAHSVNTVHPIVLKHVVWLFCVNIFMGIFELFQHEKNGKFLERLQTFRKSLSICGRAGNQVFMWFVTFWGCPEPIFSTRGQIWCENETFAEINLLHKIASNSETVWSWEKFRTIPESCWDWLSTCTGCAVITSTIWLIQGVL